MEEDEQEQAGPDPKQEEEEEEPRRCGKHPSQLLTGICSSCLMERLSSVRDQPTEAEEIVEVDGPAADTGKLRKTLMLLFQLDDSTSSVAQHHLSEGNGSQAAAEIGGDRGRRKSGSWLRSILPRRGMWWRKSGGSVKAPSPPPPPQRVDPSPSGSRGAGVHVERKISFRRSSDWRLGRDPSKGSVADPPRHSWDGAMVGRAFACSFACLEDPPDGTARRARRSNVEELVGGVAETTNGGRHSADEGRRIRGRVRGDTTSGLPETPIPGVGRRRSNRWSRVWDRSITSPLKEFVRKGEHVLERSLSESRREVRRGKNAEAADIGGGELQPGRSNGHVSGRASQGAVRSSSQAAASVGDAPNFRTDWLRNKESKIGRSRSVHYTSPGNLDNGMLRFYLTPMRTTRTANRGRRRNPRLFGRGLFGFI